MKVAIIHNRDQSGVINVFGPQNREKYNPKTVERVAAALEKGGHNVRVIDGNMHVIDQLRDFMPRVMSGERPGMVFNMAYGIQGVSRYTHLPAMLEMLGVPYVGSNPLAHGLALDKVIAKIVFQNAGLPTARFWNFASADEQFDDLTFPLIVKPKMEAVSYGVKVVDNEKDLREAVDFLIREFQQHVLVEQFIAGREFAIGLLGNGEPEVLPIVEVDLHGDPNAIQSAEEKLRTPLDKICPAPLDDDTAEHLRAVARKAFRSLDLFDFARVDVRMDEDENPYILEINSMASLGLTGTYVRAAQEAGYSYEGLINRIVDVAAMRYFGPDSVSQNGASEKRPAEKGSVSARVRSYLRSQAETIEDSLERMVEMRTPATDVERVNAFGEWITSQLEGLGFRVKAYPGVNVGLVLYFTNHDADTNDVLLLSHLDTAAGQEHQPFRGDETRLYGSGIAESKGGLAVAIAALRALRWARVLRRVKCGILLTTDDTQNGARARPIVEELAPHSRHIIGLKAGDPDGGLTVSRSGRATYTIEVDYPRRARLTQAEAVTHLTERALALQALTNAKAGIRIGVTHIDLKAAFGRLPDRAEAGITVRFESASAASTIDERVRAVAQDGKVKGARVLVTGGVRRPPMKKSKANQLLFDDVARIAGKMNVTVTPVHRPSSSDICFAPASIPKIDGMGPIGDGVRTKDERILRYSLIERAALLANVLLLLATGSEP